MSTGSRFFTTLLFLLDLFFINLSFYLAHFLRLGNDFSLQYFILWAYLNVATLLTFLGLGMYNQGKNFHNREEIFLVLKSVAISVMIVFSSATFVYYRTYYFSRKIFLYYWMLTATSLSLARCIFKNVEISLINQGIGIKRILVIGADQTGQEIRKKIERERLLGYQFVGFLDDNITGEHIIGKLKDFESLMKNKAFDQVFLTISDRFKRKTHHITLLCKKYGIKLSIISPIFNILNQTVTTNKFFGIPTIHIRPAFLHAFNRMIKRVLDIIFALSMIVLFLPLWIIITTLIKLDSPGPVFFKQTRVGRGGRLFQLYKFRSMCNNADMQLEKLRSLNETNGPIFKMADDPRITRVGRWLRRGSLDEFPQFINVLKGEMSVVGPRPPIPEEVAKYDEWHKRRLDIDQGITGLWQISGRSKLSFEEMVLLDIIYMENWSIWWDMAIILKTIPTVLRAEGAY